MKTPAFIALLMVYSSISYSFQFPEIESLQCRSAVSTIDATAGVAHRVEQDLIDGIWSLKTPNTQLSFHFKDFGMLDLVETGANGKTAYRNALWQLEETGGKPLLVLNGKHMGQAKQFTVEQTCQGIVLTDPLSLESFNLVHQPLASALKINLLKANMVGDWTNVTYPFTVTSDLNQCGTFEEMKGAFLRYRFHADGTFNLSYGNAMTSVKEAGMWELGMNGEYLLLHITEKEGVKQRAETRLAKVIYVGDHELLLEQSLTTSGEFSDFFCTDTKSFTFVK